MRQHRIKTSQSYKFSGNCPKCGTWRRRLQRDHVISLWYGGIDHESNIQLLCANCHEDKSYEERQMPEFRAHMSQMLKGNDVQEKLRSNVTRAKISVALRGRTCSEEHRARMREGWANRRKRLEAEHAAA